MKKGDRKMKTKWNVKEMALIGMLGTVAALLMLIRTPLPFMPPFMDFDLAALPEIIGGFALGPVAAIFIIIVKLIVKLAMLGTSTAFTGELSNFILSCSYMLPAIWIYNYHKSKHSAMIGMIVGTFVCAIMAVITNVFMIIPFYAHMFGWTIQDVVDMCHAVAPFVNNTVTLALFGIIPFNLIKNGVASFITYIVYKKLSVPLKRFASKN